MAWRSTRVLVHGRSWLYRTAIAQSSSNAMHCDGIDDHTTTSSRAKHPHQRTNAYATNAHRKKTTPSCKRQSRVACLDAKTTTVRTFVRGTIYIQYHLTSVAVGAEEANLDLTFLNCRSLNGSAAGASSSSFRCRRRALRGKYVGEVQKSAAGGGGGGGGGVGGATSFMTRQGRRGGRGGEGGVCVCGEGWLSSDWRGDDWRGERSGVAAGNGEEVNKGAPR